MYFTFNIMFFRVKDYSSGGSRISQTVGAKNIIFPIFFPKNCMKMKEIEPGGRPWRPPPLDPPLL